MSATPAWSSAGRRRGPFMTLEDETGFWNAVVWESVFQRYSVLDDVIIRIEAKTVSFLRSQRNPPG
jgi:hypothetical protein